MSERVKVRVHRIGKRLIRWRAFGFYGEQIRSGIVAGNTRDALRIGRAVAHEYAANIEKNGR